MHPFTFTLLSCCVRNGISCCLFLSFFLLSAIDLKTYNQPTTLNDKRMAKKKPTESLLDAWKRNKSVIQLKNKTPVWNEGMPGISLLLSSFLSSFFPLVRPLLLFMIPSKALIIFFTLIHSLTLYSCFSRQERDIPSHTSTPLPVTLLLSSSSSSNLSTHYFSFFYAQITLYCL